jgi:hypothetical protein
VKKQPKVEKPSGVYFETSLICRLPPDLDTAGFSRLVELCRLLKIPILIPRVALEEWIWNIKKEFLDNLEHTERSLESCNRLLETKAQIRWPKKKERMVRQIETRIISRLKDLKIEILKTPRISLKLLLKMAVNKTRPFEEKGEKGFRDTVILFTVLYHAKRSPGEVSLFLTADKAYGHQDVCNLLMSQNMKLEIIDSISGAVEYLEQFLGEAVRKYIKLRTDKLRLFLKSHKREIMEYIRKKTDFRLGSVSVSSEFPVRVRDIRKIISIEFLAMGKIIPGTFPEIVSAERIKISFSVKLLFTVIVKQPPLAALAAALGDPKFRLNEETGTWEREHEPLLQQFSPQEGEAKLEYWVSVEATVRQNKHTKEYSDLEIENVSI